MYRERALKRLKNAGYKITYLGRNIRTEKTFKKGNKEKYTGSVTNVFKQIFGYR